MVRRQIPRWSELRPLLRVEPPKLNPTERRLSNAHTIADLRAIARRRTPRAVFDYTDGAAESLRERVEYLVTVPTDATPERFVDSVTGVR